MSKLVYEGDSPIFAAETVDYWAKTPFVPRKLGQSPVNGYPRSWYTGQRVRPAAWSRTAVSPPMPPAPCSRGRKIGLDTRGEMGIVWHWSHQ